MKEIDLQGLLDLFTHWWSPSSGPIRYFAPDRSITAGALMVEPGRACLGSENYKIDKETYAAFFRVCSFITGELAVDEKIRNRRTRYGLETQTS
jgi:hypothetical protein